MNSSDTTPQGFPLSREQRRTWLWQTPSAFHGAAVVRIEGELEGAAVRRALVRLIAPQ